MPQVKRPRQQSTPQIDEYYRLELAQVVQRIDSLGTLRVQLGTFFGTANLTALGIALSVQKAGIFFIAASMLVIYLLLDAGVRVLSVAYHWRGLELQKKFVPNDKETFLQVLPGVIASEARRLTEKENAPFVKERLSRSWIRFQGFLFRGRSFSIPIIVVLGEVVTGLLLWLRFKWSLF